MDFIGSFKKRAAFVAAIGFIILILGTYIVSTKVFSITEPTITIGKPTINAAKPSDVFTVDKKFDKTKPVITLTGNAVDIAAAGESYIDAGATAMDNYDGNLTNKIVKSGSVDTTKEGTYTLTYDVTDTNGNKAVQITRTVKVAAMPAISLDSHVVKNNITDTYGRMYFLSTVTVPKGCKPIEYGVVMSTNLNKTNGLDLNHKSATVQALKQDSKGQFYCFFNVIYDRAINVKAYVIYKDAAGVQKLKYSNMVTATLTKQGGK